MIEIKYQYQLLWHRAPAESENAAVPWAIMYPLGLGKKVICSDKLSSFSRFLHKKYILITLLENYQKDLTCLTTEIGL